MTKCFKCCEAMKDNGGLLGYCPKCVEKQMKLINTLSARNKKKYDPKGCKVTQETSGKFLTALINEAINGDRNDL